MQNLLFGLIGYPLGHSRSPELFMEFFRQEGIINAEYKLFPIQAISDLHTILKENPALEGKEVKA